MINTERVFLFLLITICLLISIVVVSANVDPSLLISTVFASGEFVPGFGEGLFTPEEMEEILPLVQEGWEIYRDEGYGFEIQFPKTVVRKSVLNQNAINSGVGVAPDAPVWKFTLDDPSLYQGTNLVDASLLVHVLRGDENVNACSSFKPGSIYQTPNQMRNQLLQEEINGNTFWKDEVLEGGMGKFYRRISYRMVSNGACYELTLLIHSRNIEGFVEGEVSSFDEDKVIAALDEVLATFTLIDVEPTFPKLSYPEPKTITTAVSKDVSKYVDGIDVSHWQGDIKWAKVGDAGIEFAFVKGTEGVGWTDVKFFENMDSGPYSGVVRGVYHFARPNLGNTGAEEANYFLSVVGDYLNSGHLRPVLDLEVGSSLGATYLSNWVLEWMQTVENRTGISPLLYTNLNYINNYLNYSVTEYDLWIAYWSCYPAPTYDRPPTGKWRDWAFWQYYGPGGCGSNSGFIPGIQTDIDLNIFNGVSAGLQEYDAYSHLWVSLSSDAYFSPIPYYADIIANVNGDTTGPIDFSFWWDCDALEADVGAVEAICGVLPTPAEGECQNNEFGQKCIGIQDELQLAEHTFLEVGNYTAKVIVERGTASPAEDRYKISTYYPLRSLSLSPGSPGDGDVNEPYLLNVGVEIHSGVGGALQVTVGEIGSGEIINEKCRQVDTDIQTIEKFTLTWTETEMGDKFYDVWARYRPWGDCPVTDSEDNDLYKAYQIGWDSINPYLRLRRSDGTPVLSGSIEDLGELEINQLIEREYVVYNPSTVNDLEITTAIIENPIDVIDPQIIPTESILVGPGEEQILYITFTIEEFGPFSFDIVLDHNGKNPTPYTVTLQGDGVLDPNPIQSITPIPVSPGEQWVGYPYNLQVEALVDVTSSGALQLSLEDGDGIQVQDPQCVVLEEPGLIQQVFDFEFIETVPSLKDYTIWARYRTEGSCPVTDIDVADISQAYQVNWEEDIPVVEIRYPDGSPIPSGGSDDLGVLEPYSVHEFEYGVYNTSTTNNLQITANSFENSINVLEERISPMGTIDIGPGEEQTIVVSFEIENTGPFSFDILFEHDASNPSPYEFSVLGNGELSANPIQSILATPLTPGEQLIGEVYDLLVEVDLDVPIRGALQVGLEDQDGIEVVDSQCILITDEGESTQGFDFSWTVSEIGLMEYSIWARYRVRGSCPLEGADDFDLSEAYQINWVEDSPELELQDSDANVIPPGDVHEVGQIEYLQDIELEYVVHNTSTTSDLEVSDVQIENLKGLSSVSTSFADSIILGPGESQSLLVSFQVENTGAFGFDLWIDHDGGNPSPYQVSIQGIGVITNNPIKFITANPISPGTALIGESYQLTIDVGIAVPDQGALHVSLLDVDSGEIRDQGCKTLEDNLTHARTFDFSWTRTDPMIVDYTIWPRYQAQGDCPVGETFDTELSQDYVIHWEEEAPELVVQSSDGTVITNGGNYDAGDIEFYQQVEHSFMIMNASTTTSMQVVSIYVENLININQVDLTVSSPITLEPEGQHTFTAAYLVSEVGSYGFEIVIEHDGSNPSPYQLSVQGVGVMSSNPIQSISSDPVSPGTPYVNDLFQLDITTEVDPPAPGVLEIKISEDVSGAIVDEDCVEIESSEAVDIYSTFSWSDTAAGEKDYLITAQYQAEGNCPLHGSPDAELSQSYQVSWREHKPILEVKRPEGVSIFDGSVDYVGEHDFYRMVEVTYVIKNGPENSFMTIEEISAENLVNLRNVKIEPSRPIVVDPGEEQAIKVSFQVLILEPYSFDLVWEHDADNESPYTFTIQGDAALNLGDYEVSERWYNFIVKVINTGIFLRYPHLVEMFTRGF